jgi:iron complex outermembrane recepter protein
MSYPRHHLALAISALLTAGTASAQSSSVDSASASSLDSVTVTGSHIKRLQISGVGPVSVIDAEAIERSGATSVETLLQRLPASAGFAGSQTNAYWAENGYGTTQVNLRGLGINRTLVLLNGRRVVNGGTGANSSVDLNVIPVAMIERIEVLKDGASAIYGADAVAGVVNVITKKNYDGGEAAVRYGRTFKGDG